MSVIPQVRINGGAPTTGDVLAAAGDTIQPTAASYSTFGSPVARWEIYDFPPAFTVPAGWLSSGSGDTLVFYWDGNGNPPALVADERGAYMFHLSATEGNSRVLAKVMVSVPLENGLRQIARGEGELYGGPKKRWVKKIQEAIAATGSGGGGSLPAADYASLVALESSGRMVYNGENGGILALDVDLSQPITPGAAVEIFAEAGTATAPLFSTIVDPDGSLAALFNAAEDFTIFLTGTTSASFVASAQSRPALAVPAAPTVDAAGASGPRVDAGDLDKLILPFSAAVMFPATLAAPTGDITGLSLGGTMATPRTITGVVSGNGTDEVTLDLSGDLNVADAPTIVIASDREVRAFGGGTKVAAGSTLITIVGNVYDYATATGLTALMDPEKGNGSLADGAVCASWTSDAGTAAPVFTAAGGARPTFRASKSGMPAMEFDGVANIMSTTDTIGDVFNATTGMWLAAVWIDAISGSANSATPYQNIGLMCDAVGYVGLFVKTDPLVVGYIFDGSVEPGTIGNASRAIATGAWHIVGVRWTGNVLSVMVDGTWSAGEPLDAGITTLTDVIRLGRGPGGGLWFDGWMGKNLFFDAIPGDLAAIVTSLKAEYGVP